jgi:1,2-diacylglycerol-3-alpha-glucose alpha-1,2-glucosyltransferase
MLSVNLVYGTHGESGILTSIRNTQKMLELLEPDGVRFYQNSMKICDVVHAHTFGPIALLLVLFHKARRKAVVIHTHTTPQDIANSYTGAKFVSTFLTGYLRFFYNLADVCIAPSAYAKEVIKSTLKVKSRLTILSNGIDLSSYECNEKRAARFKVQHGLDDRPLILSVGLVFVRKGIVDFVDMAKKLPRFRFVWVGRVLARPFLPKAAKKVLEATPENVLFTGRVDSVCEALSAADVFVFPSYEENQGIAALEAAACEVPLILRDLPAFSDFVDGQNCVKFTTVDEFKCAISNVVTNRTRAEKLRKNARKIVQNHDIHVVSKKLLQVYLTAKRD